MKDYEIEIIHGKLRVVKITGETFKSGGGEYELNTIVAEIELTSELLKDLAKALKPYLDSIENCEVKK